MKKLIVFFAFLSLMVSDAWAATILGTSNPPSSPLTMSAGTTSALMSVNVVSNNPPNDAMASWNIQLEILPNTGANGTLTFQTPATGTPSNPPLVHLRRERPWHRGHQHGQRTERQRFLRPQHQPGDCRAGIAGSQLAPDDVPRIVQRVRAVRHLCGRGIHLDAMDR